MQLPLQITARDVSLSEAAKDNIRAKVEHLETYYDGLLGCRVIVQGPGLHHRVGPFTVRVSLSVPGDELVSVLHPGFDRLAIGTEVRFVEEPGEKGPQASTVAITGIPGL